HIPLRSGLPAAVRRVWELALAANERMAATTSTATATAVRAWSRGRIWMLSSASVNFVVKDAADVVIYAQDIGDASESFTGPDERGLASRNRVRTRAHVQARGEREAAHGGDDSTRRRSGIRICRDGDLGARRGGNSPEERRRVGQCAPQRPDSRRI